MLERDGYLITKRGMIVSSQTPKLRFSLVHVQVISQLQLAETTIGQAQSRTESMSGRVVKWSHGEPEFLACT